MCEDSRISEETVLPEDLKDILCEEETDCLKACLERKATARSCRIL